MNIGILGIGHVGRALGGSWVKAGHNVVFGVRDPENAEKVDIAGQIGAHLDNREAVSQAEAILLAVPWVAVPDALQSAGDLSGKLLLDCTNPVNSDFTALTIGHEQSGGEIIAKWVPQARVVKIFNTNGSNNMANPRYGEHRVSMFYAGDDHDANQRAAGLAADIGFEPIELGPLSAARLLEPLAMTWIQLARHRGFGRDIAIDLVRRPRE